MSCFDYFKEDTKWGEVLSMTKKQCARRDIAAGPG